MKKIFLFALPVFIVFHSSFAQQPVDAQNSMAAAQVQKFDPMRDVKKDIQEVITQAQRTHRRILLDVGGEWCIWCHRLDSLFLRNKDLTDYLHKHYIVVKVNVSKENMNQEFLATFPKVAGYPHLFVLDSKGNLLHSQDTGDLEYPKNYPVKGHDKKKVFAFLKKWA